MVIQNNSWLKAKLSGPPTLISVNTLAAAPDRGETDLANSLFGLVHVVVGSAGAVNHAPHLRVHGVPLEGVHGLGADLVVDSGVQHCTVGQFRLLGQVLERPGQKSQWFLQSEKTEPV